MSAWKPSGPMTDTRTALSADSVEAVGIAGNPKVLADNWKRYKNQQTHTDSVTLAFVRACTACSRRAPAHVTPIIQELADFPNLDHDCFHDLAIITAELGDLETAKTLLKRSIGIKRPQGFYLNLIHLAAETTKDVDMVFAAKVCDEMAAHSIPQCFPQLKMMLHGYAREPEPKLSVILDIISYAHEKSGGTTNVCFMQKAVGILESFGGEDALAVNQFASEQIGSEVMDQLVDGVIPDTYNGDASRHTNTTQITYYIIDPFGANVEAKMKLPENTYLMFLYSSLRHLCEKCITCGVNHPLSMKAELIRQFLDTNAASAVVFPWEHEIMLHADPTVELQNTAHSKMVCFMKRIRQTCSPQCKLVFVTTDRALTAEVSKIGNVEVVSAFPSEVLSQ